MAKSKNGKVLSGIPFGSMTPPAKLASGVSGIASAEKRILVSRVDLKAGMAAFYKRFRAKFPKAGTADFARQFSKDVPFKREDYKRDATYNAIENMFRYMPEVKTGGKAEDAETKAARILKAKKETKKRKQQAEAMRKRAERLAVAIVNQIGIPPVLFEIAAQRIGFSKSEIETMLNAKNALVDVGLGTYQMVVRSTGVPAIKALSKVKSDASRQVQSIPTAAELANQAKSRPTVTVVAPDVPAPAYKGKGLYQRTIKRGDNLSKTAAV